MRYITAVVLFTIGATVQALPVPDSQDAAGLRLRFGSADDIESGLTDALRLELFAKPAINVGGKSNGPQIAIRYLSPGKMATYRKWFQTNRHTREALCFLSFPSMEMSRKLSTPHLKQLWKMRRSS
jgi:hypothetical protein